MRIRVFQKISSWDSGRISIWIFILAFLARAIYTIYFYAESGYSQFSDDRDYISYAREIAAQGIAVPDIDRIFTNGHQVGIGWPFILYLLFSLFGEHFWLVFIFNVLVSSFHAVLIFLTGKLVFNKAVGLAAALWAVPYMNFIKFVPTVLKENLIHFFFFLCLYLFVRILKERKTGLLIYFSLAFTALIHIDERYFSLFPFFALFILFDRYKVSNWRSAFIYVGIVVLLMVPWFIRNYQVYERPVILAYQTTEFTDPLLGYHPDSVVTGYESGPTPYSRKYIPAYEEITRDLLAGREIDSAYKKYAYVKDLRRAISMGLVPETYTYGENLFEEFKEFFRVYRFEYGWMANGYRLCAPRPFFNNIVFIVQFGILLPFCFIGLFYSLRNRNRFAGYLLFFASLYAFIHIVLVHVVERYRVPVDGIILIFSFYGLYIIFVRTRAAKALRTGN